MFKNFIIILLCGILTAQGAYSFAGLDLDEIKTEFRQMNRHLMNIEQILIQLNKKIK